MASGDSTIIHERTGWVTAIALVASRRRLLPRHAAPEHPVCWWNRGGFTIPYCALAAGLNRDYACCMRGLSENPPPVAGSDWAQEVHHGN